MKNAPNDIAILIVDDNQDCAVALKSIMQIVGFKVDIVLSGYEAVENIKAKSYDFVVMDIGLPGIDGIQTTKIIKEHLRNFNNIITSIVGIGCYPKEELWNECNNVGMSHYMQKPISASKLVNYFIENTNARESSSSI